MQSRDFCYWLQGYFELTKGRDELTAEQANTIRNHLNLVFLHEIDPAMGNKPHQDQLNAAHNGTATTVFPQNPIMRC